MAINKALTAGLQLFDIPVHDTKLGRNSLTNLKGSVQSFLFQLLRRLPDKWTTSRRSGNQVYTGRALSWLLPGGPAE